MTFAVAIDIPNSIKLKDFDVIPKEFESTPSKFDPLKKELDKFSPSND